MKIPKDVINYLHAYTDKVWIVKSHKPGHNSGDPFLLYGIFGNFDEATQLANTINANPNGHYIGRNEVAIVERRTVNQYTDPSPF